MNERELQLWLRSHGDYAGQKENLITVGGGLDEYKNPIPSKRVVESITYEANDGATITVKPRPADPEGTMGPSLAETDAIYIKSGETPPDKTRLPAQRTPEQVRADVATATKTEYDNAEELRKNNERSWNQNPANRGAGGSGLPETHLEKAERIAREREAQRRDDAEQRAQESSDRATAAQEAANKARDADRAQAAADAAANRGLTQQEIDIRRGTAEREANKPTFLSQADAKTPNITRYDPQTGKIESIANPNYDSIKALAEEKRAEMATLIAQRQISLQEGQQQYKQWFDSNVQTPLLLAQEARSRAEEQRQALDAEERRNQFAADFGLRKATLGESASARAVQAEQSLLPYRAGPTESAEMSAAINSLGAGGKIAGPDAGAGVHFTPGAFEFDAPDFASIAAKAAKQVLSGLTDYRPSDEKYQRADYSTVPAVNTSGAPTIPSYTYPTPTP